MTIDSLLLEHFRKKVISVQNIQKWPGFHKQKEKGSRHRKQHTCVRMYLTKRTQGSLQFYIFSWSFPPQNQVENSSSPLVQSWWILRVVLVNTVWEVTPCACGPALENTMCLIWGQSYHAVRRSSRPRCSTVRKSWVFYPNTHWDPNLQPGSTSFPEDWNIWKAGLPDVGPNSPRLLAGAKSRAKPFPCIPGQISIHEKSKWLLFQPPTG